ncbi:acetyl-CoA carboxylase carboxyl transferase subunit alpha [Granulicatella sp. WM01]|nr:carboxyltransferase subunit alpha [Granulicatella sp. 19428wC4_WM01]TFU93249.1 acetyl-CoA carboxylase carboxyl transferase subunit alpha [Granulicatella sp. WM01]
MKNASEIVALARNQSKMTTRDWIHALCTNFIECKGDRCFGDDLAILGGIAQFNQRAVTVIGTQKGTDLKSNLECHFGSPLPEGYRKSYRLMEQAEKFQRPILTFINTAGANCSIESESRGIGEAIAQNLLLMSQLSVPIISVIIGEGGSGGALALALANKVYMLEHSMYAILSPEGFASILWKDATLAHQAAELMQLTPDELLNKHIIDGIFRETLGDKRKKVKSQQEIVHSVKEQIQADLMIFDKMTRHDIIQQRQKRFRLF